MFNLNEEDVPASRDALRRAAATLQAAADEARDANNALGLKAHERVEGGTIAAGIRSGIPRARKAIEMLQGVERLMTAGQPPRPRKRAA